MDHTCCGMCFCLSRSVLIPDSVGISELSCMDSSSNVGGCASFHVINGCLQNLIEMLCKCFLMDVKKNIMIME